MPLIYATVQPFSLIVNPALPARAEVGKYRKLVKQIRLKSE